MVTKNFRDDRGVNEFLALSRITVNLNHRSDYDCKEVNENVI